LEILVNQSFKEKSFQIYSLIILGIFLFSIALFSRIHGNFRVEDVMTPALFLGVILTLNKILLKDSFLPVIYISYAILITSIYVFFELLPFKALLIVGKELQYILIFLLMLGLSPDKRSEKFLYYLITSFLLIQVISGLFLLFNGVRGYYGVGYFTEKSPSLGMLMYFHGLVLSTFMYIRYKKNLFLFLTVILFILTFSVGSRTGQFIAIIFILSLIAMNFEIKFFLFSTLLILSLIIYLNFQEIYNILYYIKTDNLALDGAISRFATLLNFSETIQGSRFNSWKSVFLQAINSEPIFGCGRGCAHMSNGTFSIGMGSDNQYLKNFMEIGLIGSVIFFITCLNLLFSFFRNKKLFNLYFAYLLSLAFAGFTMELWQLSKGGSLFWFTSGLLILNLKILNKKNDSYNYSST
jgi:hypothetical protein